MQAVKSLSQLTEISSKHSRQLWTVTLPHIWSTLTQRVLLSCNFTTLFHLAQFASVSSPPISHVFGSFFSVLSSLLPLCLCISFTDWGFLNDFLEVAQTHVHVTLCPIGNSATIDRKRSKVLECVHVLTSRVILFGWLSEHSGHPYVWTKLLLTTAVRYKLNKLHSNWIDLEIYRNWSGKSPHI